MRNGPARGRLVRGLNFCLTATLMLAACAVTQAAEGPEAVTLCNSCHGEEGLPIDTSVPIIWGQEFYYLYVQLKDYKAGRRSNLIMSRVASQLSKEQMRSLAEYFAEKRWPKIGFRAQDADLAKGQSATVAGLCVQCHLGGYEGNSRVPRLAGQQVEYLERTMSEFKHKVRLNSPAKGSLLGTYEDGDIAAMARFLGAF
jgi:cytochrome c553